MDRNIPASILAAVLVATLVIGCGCDSGAPAVQPTDPIIGYWGIVFVFSDGELTYSGPGNEGYWVIYGDETVCLIESLPSGEYEKDSTFVYEREQSRFIMRFDLDPIPTQADTLTLRFSAASDTLYFVGGANSNRPSLKLVFARQDSIPDCGCDTIQ